MTGTASAEDTNKNAGGGGDVGGGGDDRREQPRTNIDAIGGDAGPSSDDRQEDANPGNTGGALNANADADDSADHGVTSSQQEEDPRLVPHGNADPSLSDKEGHDPLPISCRSDNAPSSGGAAPTDDQEFLPSEEAPDGMPPAAVVASEADRGQFSPPQMLHVQSSTSASIPGAHAVPGPTSLRRQEARSVYPSVGLGDGGEDEGADQAVNHSQDAEAVDASTRITAVLVQEPLAVRAERVLHVVNDDDDAFDENDRDVQQQKTEQQRKRMRRMQIATVASILVAVIAIVVVVVVMITMRPAQSLDIESTNTPASPAASPSVGPPTAPPTTDEFRRNNLLEIVSLVSDPDSLEDPTSPQYRALDWLQYDDEARIPLTDAERIILPDAERIIQRYVLAVFYFSTGGGGEDGDGWANDYGFLSGSHECEWTDGTSGVDGCDDGAVTSVDFANNGLVGSIPSELAALAHLQEFRLMDEPNLKGTMPTEVGLLKDLTFLSLVDNDVSGTIPSELGNLKKVMGLWLQRNSLGGTIPTELGGMSSLIWLRLHENRLTGTVPTTFSDLTTSTHMLMFGNELGGSVDFLCDSLEGNLEELSVDLDEVQCKCCNCCD